MAGSYVQSSGSRTGHLPQQRAAAPCASTRTRIIWRSHAAYSAPAQARSPYPTGMLRFWDHRIAVLARLAGDATQSVQTHRWIAVPAATLGRQQMAAPSG